jgi:hypothetical protein
MGILFGLLAVSVSFSAASFAQEQDGHTIKLEPKIKSSKNASSDQIIPLSKIKPFLSHSKILPPHSCQQHWPSIQALKGEHIVIGKGDNAYAAPITYPIGTVLSVFRLGKKLVHPKTQAYLGTEADVIGEAELIRVNSDQVGKLKILSSYREIRSGDLLMPRGLEKTNLNFKLKNRSSKKGSEGEIIDVGGGVSQIGQHQIVTITGGKNCGREIGEVLEVRHEANRDDNLETGEETKAFDRIYPKEKTGELWVVNVFDQVSYALVVNATQPIYLLDTVASP